MKSTSIIALAALFGASYAVKLTAKQVDSNPPPAAPPAPQVPLDATDDGYGDLEWTQDDGSWCVGDADWVECGSPDGNNW